MVGLLLFLFLLFSFSCQAPTQVVVAVLQGTGNAPGASGVAIFYDQNGQYYLNLTVSGANSETSLVGIHVHQYGDISDFTAGLSAGLHYNPANVSHGCPGVNVSGTFHRGDLGMVQMSNGSIQATLGPFNYFTLNDSLSYVGHTFIVHQNPDSCGNPLGNAGSRLLMGVLGIANYPNNSAISLDSTVTSAVCELQGTSGNSGIRGRVLFTQNGATIQVSAFINGINGTHGFHIHQYGDLTVNTGTSAGEHFNPAGSLHAIPPYQPRHVGDMGNVYYYDSNGTAWYSYNNELIQFTGTNGILGHAVILHALQDNCSQPVGAAGARVAYCVIGVANPTGGTVILPVGVPTTQDDSLCLTSATTASPSPSNSDASFVIVSVFLSTILFLFSLMV